MSHERRWSRWVLIAAMAVTIGCDQASKRAAHAAFAGQPTLSLLGDTVRVAYAENTGAFLSLGADLPPRVRFTLFTIGSALLTVVLAVVAIRSRWTLWPMLGATLIIAGGASNAWDRAIRGYVVDFLNVGVGPLRSGIFNVADAAIMAGTGVLALAALRRRLAEGSPTTAGAGSDAGAGHGDGMEAVEQVRLRFTLQPGDIGTIVHLHGVLYAREHGFDHTFEAYVAGPLAAFALSGAERERIWIAERGERFAGCIAIVARTPDEAQLRWFLVDPAARGAGLGARLLHEAVTFSRANGYRSISLWTVSALEAAAHLYRKAGFHKVEEKRGRMWGADVVEERYVMDL